MILKRNQNLFSYHIIGPQYDVNENINKNMFAMLNY